MIFRKLLLEAEPSKSTQQQEAEAEQTQTVEKTIDNLNLPEKAMEKVASGDWEGAYDELATEEDIISLIEYFLATYPPFANLQEKLNAIKNPLIRWMRGLGRNAFRDTTNPMLVFLPEYFNQGKQFTEDEFRKLVNLYARGIISEKQLREKDVHKNILLNQNLYSMAEPDLQFVVQAYLWLSKENNIKSYLDLKEYKTLNDNREQIISQAKNSENYEEREKLEKQLKQLYNIDLQLNSIIGEQGKVLNDQGKMVYDVKKLDYKKFRDLIIFKDLGNPLGEINSAQEIRNKLDKLEQLSPASDYEPSGTTTRRPTQSGRKTVEFSPQRYSNTEIQNILQKGINNLTKSDVSKLLTFLSEFKGAK